MIESAHAAELRPTFAQFALEKLTRVLGPERGHHIYQETLEAVGLTDLRTADELHAFAQRLSSRGGFEAAVGGLLSVAAVLRGARGERG
jgi:hypothetical protein